MTASLSTRHHAGFALVALVLVAVAFANRLTVDDAFIYYRYASHWLDGLGLVWNPGEAVEGFTSLPWVYWVAACLALGLDPALSGLAFFAVALVLLYAASLRATASTPFALLAVAAYGANYTISCFATGGLETSLHLMLVVAACWLFLSESRLVALSVTAGLAFAVRMDSVLLVAPLLVAAVWAVHRGAGARRSAVAVFAPALAIGVAFMGARWILVGNLVPNTYHVKLGGARDLARGFDYVALFHHDYGLLLVALPALFVGATLAVPRERRIALVGLVAMWLSWCGYVIWIGGDFMEFRMMTPALAPLLLAIAVVWRDAGAIRGVIATALAVVVLHAVAVQVAMRQAAAAPFTGAALRQNRYPFYAIPRDADSIPMLDAHLHHPQDDWIAVGRRLGEVFGHGPGVTIATTAAGAVPYFSRLPTVDMLGLNDRWIARHGRELTTRPGHARGATAEYLIERGVDLVVAHPVMVPRDRLPDVLATVPPRHFWFERVPPGASLIALPVNDAYAVVLLYLGGDPVVDAAIVRERLLVVRAAG